jgi:predicted AlkP superfamily pyrophosphatase or phosphodiesterase
MILVDAFSQAYFSKSHTPFMFSLAESGFSSTLDPMFAYRGIDTTIFTGVWPNIHNVWTEFKIAENTRTGGKMRLMQASSRFVDVLPTDRSRAMGTYFLQRYFFNEFYKTPHSMPAAALPYFESSQLKETFEPGAVNELLTIFDVFRAKGVEYVCVEPWLRGDKGVLDKTKDRINRNSSSDFWYVKFSNLDHLGHRFGPDPSMFEKQLIKIDEYVEEVVTLLRKKCQNLNVLVVGDHGMSKVHYSVNILEELRKMQSQIYEDYVAFADSTMIRFWFFNERATKEICEFIRHIRCGHVLSATEKELLKIPMDPSFGEAIFVLDEGYVVHPSFFNSKSRVKGMHGYAYPKTAEAFPVIIVNGEMAISLPMNDRLKFTDIAHLILQSIFQKTEQAGLGLLGYMS